MIYSVLCVMFYVPYILHGGVSGSALECGACKSCWSHRLESVKLASQFKKSQTTVSTAERYFTLSVVCLRVECTRRQG